LSLRVLVRLFIFLSALLFGSGVRAEELNVYFKTTPGSQLLRPFVDPTDLSLLVTTADGRPIKQGTVAIRVDAPRPGRVFSTDIPMIEGTLLNRMELPLREGRANWKQLFPIRGEYRVSVDVISADGMKASKAFAFTVRENEKKWLALGAFSSVLFILGFLAGRVFTGTGLSAVPVVFTAALLAAGISGAPQAEGLPKGVLEIEPAIVGRPSAVRWKLAGDDRGGARAATLTLTITHLEKKKVVFAVDRIAVPGEWSMQYNFPDGAEYRVVAAGYVSGQAPVRNEQVVTVTGVEPPASAMVPVLTLFTVLIALGLGAGRWSKRRALIFRKTIP
jgi:hypothetical protein